MNEMLAYMGIPTTRTDWDEPIQVKSLAEMSLDFDPPERMPVRNREDRQLYPPVKYALIMQRDGGVCRDCGQEHNLVLDHIIPRSAFPAEHIKIADRSDNLQVMCWNHNTEKSNYDHGHRKRPGVTIECWECETSSRLGTSVEDEDFPAMSDIYPGARTHLAYCGKCGYSAVPSLDWIL